MLPKKPYNADRRKRGVRRLSKAAATPERDIQLQAEALLSSLGVVYIHIPDAVYRLIHSPVVSIGQKMQIASALAGFPDIIIPAQKGYEAHNIELKTEKGKLSTGQVRFRDSVGVDNYTVCRSVDDVLKVLKKLKK